MNRVRRIAQCVSLWFLTIPSLAHAQDAALAEALFNRGVAEMKEGKFDTACPALAESQKQDPRPGTLFTLAECYAKADKVASALLAYDDFIRSVDALPAGQKARYRERVDVATAQMKKLSALVPELTLMYPKEPPAGIRLFRNGTEVPWLAVGVPIRVDPGEQSISVEIPGKPNAKWTIQLGKGEKKSVFLGTEETQAEPAAKPATLAESVAALAKNKIASRPPDETPPSPKLSAGRKAALMTSTGIGVAGLIVGGIGGGLALGEKSTRDAHCDELQCDSEGMAAVEAGRTYSTVGTVGFVVGGAAIATTLILWVTRPTEKSPIQAQIDVRRGYAGIDLRGTF